MSEPDYKTAAYVALDGIAARASVEEPKFDRQISEEQLEKYVVQIEDTLHHFFGALLFQMLSDNQIWAEELRLILRNCHTESADKAIALHEKFLTKQAMAQTRGMFSGLLRASSEG